MNSTSNSNLIDSTMSKDGAIREIRKIVEFLQGQVKTAYDKIKEREFNAQNLKLENKE